MTPREKEITAVLCNSIRVMSIFQIAQTWWSLTPWGISRTKSVIKKMSDEGWLKLQQAVSRPVTALERPLVVWSPGATQANFTRLSRRLHTRASEPAEIISVVFATEKANRIFGVGKLATVKLTQMTHDLHVTEIYLNYRRRGLAERWIGEDRFPGWWPIDVRPDAALQNRLGGLTRAIEYGGDYSSERLHELHTALSGFGGVGLSYEIW